ncbi:hypothetical protein [Roseivirga pacifica]|uniref:hypothetical protein n=1 Tax=Roseivirga pacifica TaxID=1267423 RepID=UPI00209500CE|nr:hypothetical protein [Roseivirga pacifica]MCO6358933.1 hypothetical protein [Roseivirga pacifica]MCO6365431.1 hypothetical protein [Roseivirga pacifica]MCO6371839.1 hypothetical protein [Roseivirga pacifica]MCO6376050.1 hypothetical protein [Roseivirga pacifica]MCO6379217.1 hypothetical protein [Roseivirga pacifica]
MNKQSTYIFALIGAMLLAVGCAGPSVPQKTTTTKADLNYSDDLKKYRPEVTVNTTQVTATEKVIDNEPLQTSFDLKDELQAVIDTMVVRNDTIREYSGYTILVYSGNNEIEAGRVRNRLFDIVPELEAKFSYKLPTYFVKVGEFFQQVEAQPLYRKIREHYPTASIVPDKFSIEE